MTRESRQRRLAVVGRALLILALGLVLCSSLSARVDCHQTGADACTCALASLAVLASLSLLLLNGRPLADSSRFARTIYLHLLDPPPRLASAS